MPQVQAADYYWRWLIQVIRQVVSFTWNQMFAGLLLGMLILLYQLHYGVVQKAELRTNELAIIWPYLDVIIGVLVYQAIRAPLVLDRERADDIQRKEQAIQSLQDDLQKAVSVTASDYSKVKLAKLADLSRSAAELFQQSSISLNQANPRALRDDWMRRHDKWRDDVLDILQGRHAEIFMQPISAGYETQGLKGAIDEIHGHRRGQLLGEIERLTRILERNQDSTT